MDWSKLLHRVLYGTFGLLFLLIFIFAGINVAQFVLSQSYAGLQPPSFIANVAAIAMMYLGTIAIVLAVAVVTSLWLGREAAAVH
jgi:hypothetical protein